MSPAQWQLENPLKEFNEHLENAYKRASGLVGLKLGRDRMNMDALSGSAGQILDISGSGEPFFVRIGRSVGAVADYRPKDELSLKELAAEVLGEFHGEAVGAFQETRARMARESSAWLQAHGLPDDERQRLLATAEEAFLPPSREDMTRAALPHVGQVARPGTWAGLGGLAGFGLMIITLRHPLFLALGTAAGAGLCYYLARGRTRTRAQALMVKLPQDLYSLLKRDLIANQSRYQEIINRAAH